jgi:hypothetical protein
MLYFLILLLSIITIYQGSNIVNNVSNTKLIERTTLSYYNKLIYLNSNYASYNRCDQNCIGIEIEVEFLKAEPNLKKWNKFLTSNAYDNFLWSDLFFIQYDYSIPYGIEINFQPLTFNDYYKINWNPFFKLLIDETATTHIDTGLHLHLPYTKQKNIYKILKLLITNKDYFIKFMNRNNISFSRFCSYEQFKYDYKNCIGKLYVLNINKYTSTIEIRGFKMTLNQTEFNNYINFMKNLDEFSLR